MHDMVRGSALKEAEYSKGAEHKRTVKGAGFDLMRVRLIKETVLSKGPILTASNVFLHGLSV
jgi:hypothetical protein